MRETHSEQVICLLNYSQNVRYTSAPRRYLKNSISKRNCVRRSTRGLPTDPVMPTIYLPTTRIENVPGTICPRPGRPPGGGAGAAVNSAVIRNSLPVLLSSVNVFARGAVCSVCSTTKLVWLFSFTI